MTRMTRRRIKGDVEYYAPRRKKPIAYSTTATLNTLKVAQAEYPSATMRELRARLETWVAAYEARAVLDAFIAAGCGDEMPNLR